MIRFKFHKVLIFLLIHFSTLLCAQKEYNNWYFGDSAGISFSGGTPIPLLDGVMDQFEGCASISDENGNLLFYTNGVDVYNKNHQLMLNGSGLYGNQSTTQSVLIIQRPLCKKEYYVFTVICAGGPSYYSIVNMNLNNGIGGVESKNNFLKGPVSEKLTAIRHQNGVDIWIVLQDKDFNIFYSYLVSKNGVSPSPVVSSFGPKHIWGWAGYLKPSPKGNVLVSANYNMNNFDLFKFNRSTGTFGSSIVIGTFDTLLFLPFYYGVEFSPDGNLLYAKADTDSMVNQYKISIYDSIAISNSKTPVGKVIVRPMVNKYQIGALQTGPDGKIYIANTKSNFLSCINSPNKVGQSCNFIDSAVYLDGRECSAGLPNNPFTAPYIQQDGCFTGMYSFHLTDTTPYQRWDFGDPLQTGDTALQANPSYTYTQPGVYTVTTIYLTDWQTYDTVTTTVYAHPIPDILGTDTLFVCNQDSIKILADSAYDRYQWNTGADTSYTWVHQSGKYYITATEACGCAVKDSIMVVYTQKPELGSDTSLCPLETIVLESSVLSSSYTWSNGSTASSILVNQPGLYWLELKDGNCIRIDSINVGAIEISLDIGKDTILCDGEELEITANGDFETIIWENGSTTLSRIVIRSGWVSAVAHKGHCSITDSLYIRPCSQIRFPNVFTPNGDYRNDFFVPEFKEISIYKLLIFNRWGQEIFRSNDPQSGWDGRFNTQECQVGTYYYSATYQFKDHHGSKEITQTGTLMLLR